MSTSNNSESAAADLPEAAQPALRLPYAYAKRYQVLLRHYDDTHAEIACPQLPSTTVLQELTRFLQRQIQLQKIKPEEFASLLEESYQATSNEAMQVAEGMREETDLWRMAEELPQKEDLLASDDDAPIIRLLNALFSQAIKQQASDIHIETFEDQIVIRFRIDGVLHEILRPQRVLAPLIISRIKVMAKLDIAEKRLPQDGRIALHLAGRAVDVRVSTMPASHGERIVLRLLDKKSARLDLSHLGMFDDTLTLWKKLIHRPHGIILVTGPTGSGKTTSLYAALTDLNDVTRNILTVEDPIEYYLPGIGQTQVNNKVNMTFARGLRAMLRQDPDVVMVGEIRDLETAEIAVQASLTGHLVLSTLHTNTAIGAITRLKDMGVEPFLLSSSLLGVAAQRLIRLLCPHCKAAKPATAIECETLGVDPDSTAMIYHEVGCEQCNFSGYSGRSGIYELIAIDETLRNMIHEHTSEQKMNHHCHQKYPSIRDDGMRRVLAGQTTLEEILRVTNEQI